MDVARELIEEQARWSLLIARARVMWLAGSSTSDGSTVQEQERETLADGPQLP